MLRFAQYLNTFRNCAIAWLFFSTALSSRSWMLLTLCVELSAQCAESSTQIRCKVPLCRRLNQFTRQTLERGSRAARGGARPAPPLRRLVGRDDVGPRLGHLALVLLRDPELLGDVVVVVPLVEEGWRADRHVLDRLRHTQRVPADHHAEGIDVLGVDLLVL